MKCSQEIVELMHKYLDEETTSQEETILREHLQQCEDCRQHFHHLKKTIAIIQSSTHIEAPSGFTANVMKALPKEKKSVGYRRWLRSHPFLSAAAVFMLLMMSSVLSLWDQGEQFSVSKQKNLKIENQLVIVPEGEVVEGDVIVRNGDIKIEGEVRGDVVVINGKKYMASAGNVTGELEEINAAFDWIWYNIKESFGKVFNFEQRDNTIESKAVFM
ncbi:anti-sigma factor family protein [Bacillus solimangrovi]|uniref:Anti-sigma factor n=1 Tax=Bacillus solimangrovi TaxID=1305675 RepID=A0A1E5LEY1_9BACI|nr:anti-sigma factor [Bacillus solimangrovi]OEH92616.1 anti-sigma factor [Bacillus solimangrovi]